jgi:peptidoglycan-associated lipoprotein
MAGTVPAKLRSLAGAAIGLLALAGCQNGPQLPRLHMPAIQSPPVCADFQISIYFEPASAAITHDAEAVLRSAAGRTRRCKVLGVDVVGLADAAGASEANLKISRDRAAAVTIALARHGFADVSIDTTAGGEAGAQGPGGALRPLRRRAEVTFRLAAKTP